MRWTVSLIKVDGEYIYLRVGAGKRAMSFAMTDDEAQQLSNRLQAYAKGMFGSETVLEYNV